MVWLHVQQHLHLEFNCLYSLLPVTSWHIWLVQQQWQLRWLFIRFLMKFWFLSLDSCLSSRPLEMELSPEEEIVISMHLDTIRSGIYISVLLVNCYSYLPFWITLWRYYLAGNSAVLWMNSWSICILMQVVLYIMHK